MVAFSDKPEVLAFGRHSASSTSSLCMDGGSSSSTSIILSPTSPPLARALQEPCLIYPPSPSGPGTAAEESIVTKDQKDFWSRLIRFLDILKFWKSQHVSSNSNNPPANQQMSGNTESQLIKQNVIFAETTLTLWCFSEDKALSKLRNTCHSFRFMRNKLW